MQEVLTRTFRRHQWNRMLSDDREAATYVKADGPA